MTDSCPTRPLNTDRSEPEQQPSERTTVDELDPEKGLEGTTFQRKNVLDSADHQLEFFGSYTDPGDEDNEAARTIEHEFEVYTDSEHRTEEGKPTAVVEAHEIVASEREQRRGGDADLAEEQQIDLTIDIDPDLNSAQEEAAIEEYCHQWHENRLHQQ